MKSQPITPIFVFVLLFSLQIQGQDTINWRPDYKLKWEDFCGAPDTSSEYGGLTHAYIEYSLSNSNDSFHTVVYCYFNKKESWIRKNTTSGIIIHEQGHFNIAEIFARKLRQAFKVYKFNPQNVNQDSQRIFKEIALDLKRMNEQYDEETDFSRNKKAQSYWNNKIVQELKKLEQFR
jgi:hypothetical protein